MPCKSKADNQYGVQHPILWFKKTKADLAIVQRQVNGKCFVTEIGTCSSKAKERNICFIFKAVVRRNEDFHLNEQLPAFFLSQNYRNHPPSEVLLLHLMLPIAVILLMELMENFS
jgi:hypothetical protein